MSEDSDDVIETPGDLIRQIRASKRITIAELAQKMGVSLGYIAKIELGQIEPTQDQLNIIKSFLG